jgi:hypothetical protein
MTINESLIYYLWQNKYFDMTQLLTTSNEVVEIIQFGNRNVSSGPDFHNAKVKIGDTIWAGNIEMHVMTSDWNRHQHQNDHAYKNVVLHVVYEHDKDINHVPVLTLKDKIDQTLLDKYDQLMNATQWIACEHSLPYVDKDKFPLWSYQFAFTRLENKYDILKKSESFIKGDWQQLMYEKISRYFGATHNSDNFETIAQRLPYTILLKNMHQPEIVESLLFGIAGLLDDSCEDLYFLNLKKEYTFQKSKYQLTSLHQVSWKRFGMYIWGTPAYRLAQFGAFVLQRVHLFDDIKSAKNYNDLKNLFSCSPSAYWHTHFNFGKTTEELKNKNLSSELIDRIIINAVIPILFTYGKERGDDELIERCIDIMSQIKSEDNSIIKKWKGYGFKPKSALDSQALIELKNNFCDKKGCLSCPIGREILKL